MRILFLLVGLFFSVALSGQNARLAQQYYNDGEYEKAAILYEKLYERNKANDYYFDRFIDCLIYLEQYERCEKAVKEEIRRQPDNSKLYVTYGKLLESQYRDEEADEQYRKAIENLPPNQYQITRLANAFIRQTKFDLAIATYEKGMKALKDDNIFAYSLGDLYRRKGEAKKMIKYYLASLNANPARIGNLKTLFQRYLQKEDYKELQAQLYQKIQEDGDALHYPELLTWVFIQEKDYDNAFRQVRAIDRRLRENGGRVYRLAEIAATDGDYDSAIKAYEYIVEKKGRASTFYLDAKREALRARRNKLVDGFDYTEEDLRILEQQYEAFLNEFGRSKITADIIYELASLEAFYLNDLDKAIKLLDEMIAFPNVDEFIQAEGKLNLADFYLMKGDIWEATLLYSQVDKAFKDDLLGSEARLRNARLSYYNGDFQWAQAQCDVLKASTSKLIANDALDLSVFIMDNLGLDTTIAAMKLYSEAELLVFQNRFEDAFQKMDTLSQDFPEHSLKDDVLYLKSKIYYKKREFSTAAELLQNIIDNHPEEIRADNALYELAKLYEKQLDDQEKAKTLYEKLFIEYSGSTFAVDARKKYRILRGDSIQ
ncbi:MAG: tetratricopeptide repeat protein [Saprospiraceae bacterium]|nr:tetratricopeptide repeat protein [Saprospiraceae bacterium]